MKRSAGRNNAYYETVEDARRKLSEASSVLEDISRKIKRLKESEKEA